MDQPKSPPPRNYFARKEQYRLLMLVSTLMLVLVMMNEARKPRNWRWMWRGQDATAQSSPVDSPIDTRMPDVAKPDLPGDGFRLLPTRSESVETKFGHSDTDYLPGISRELLAPIEDDTISIVRPGEGDAWLAMWRILQQRSQSELRKLSRQRIGFNQFFRQTNVYRGQLVTIGGTIRGLEELTVRPNELNVSRYYRWTVKPQGGSNSPILVYSLEKPDHFPIGNDLREAAEFTGFCYKRLAYLAGDGTRVAPVLLAKTATWQAPLPGDQPRGQPSPVRIVGFVLVVAVFAIAIAVVVYRSSRRVSPQIAKTRATMEAKFDRLQSEDILPDVYVALNRLATEPDPVDTPPTDDEP